MPLDIYTKQPISVPSEEHILPRALGGKLTGADLIDKVTNSQFGHGIDARLHEALHSIRVMVDARNADGEHPRPLSNVQGDDGKEYFVDPGGKPREVPKGNVTRLPSGDLQFAATVSDAPTLRKMLRRHFKGREAKLDETVSKAMAERTERKVAPPVMTFDLPLWDADPYRATAKIAFNFLALNDPSRTREDGGALGRRDPGARDGARGRIGAHAFDTRRHWRRQRRTRERHREGHRAEQGCVSVVVGPGPLGLAVGCS